MRGSLGHALKKKKDEDVKSPQPCAQKEHVESHKTGHDRETETSGGELVGTSTGTELRMTAFAL